MIYLSQSTATNFEARAFVDCGVQVSDPIWKEHVRLHDEVAAPKATICDLERQLPDKEDANSSKLQLIQGNVKKKIFIPVCHPLLFCGTVHFPETKVESLSMWTGKSDANQARDECNRI